MNAARARALGLLIAVVCALVCTQGAHAASLRLTGHPRNGLHPPNATVFGVEAADFDVSAENLAKYADKEKFVFTCSGRGEKAPKQFPAKVLSCCEPVHWLLARKINADRDSVRDDDWGTEYARAHDSSLEWLQNQVLRDPYETYSRECLEALTEAKCLGSFRRCGDDMQPQAPCASVCARVTKVCASHMDAIIFPAFRDCNSTDFWDQGNANCMTREDLGGDAWVVPDRCVSPQDLRHKDVAAFEENNGQMLSGFKPGDDELTEEKAMESVHQLQNLLVHIFSVGFNGNRDGWTRPAVMDAARLNQEVIAKEDEVYELGETLKEYLGDISSMMEDPNNRNIMGMLQEAQGHIAAAISHLESAEAHRQEFGRHFAEMLMKSKIPRPLPKPISSLPQTEPPRTVPGPEEAGRPGAPVASAPQNPSADRLHGEPAGEGKPNNREVADGMDRPETISSSNAGDVSGGGGAGHPAKPTDPETVGGDASDQAKRRQIVEYVLKAMNSERAKCLPAPMADVVSAFLLTKPVRVEGNTHSVHMSTGIASFRAQYDDNDSYLDRVSFEPAPCLLESGQADGTTEVDPSQPEVKNTAMAGISLFNAARSGCVPSKRQVDPHAATVEATQVQVVRGRVFTVQYRMQDPVNSAQFIQKLQLWSKPDGSLVLEGGLPAVCGSAADNGAPDAAPPAPAAMEEEKPSWDRRAYDTAALPDLSESMWTAAEAWADDEDLAAGVADVIPASFDARTAENTKACVRGPADQGVCGASWAFSATSVLAERYCVESGGKVDLHLSPQDAIECNTFPSAKGCCGAHPYEAWQFLSQIGVREERCVPFKDAGTTCPITASAGTKNLMARTCLDTFSDKSCTRHRASAVANGAGAGIRVKRQGRIADRTAFVNRQTSTYTRDLTMDTPEWREIERVIMSAIMAGGSVESAMVVHPDFYQYRGGVYETKGSEHGGVHTVKILGWGVDKATKKKFWLAQNSWGKDWGEGGYFRIRRGVNECRIEDVMRWANPFRSCPGDCSARGICVASDSLQQAGACRCGLGFKGADCSTVSLDDMNPAGPRWQEMQANANGQKEEVVMQYMDNGVGTRAVDDRVRAQIRFCGQKEQNMAGFARVNNLCGAKVAAGSACSGECRTALQEHLKRMKNCGDQAFNFLVLANRAATAMAQHCSLMDEIASRANEFQGVDKYKVGFVGTADHTAAELDESSASAVAAPPAAVFVALLASLLAFLAW